MKEIAFLSRGEGQEGGSYPLYWPLWRILHACSPDSEHPLAASVPHCLPDAETQRRWCVPHPRSSLSLESVYASSVLVPHGGHKWVSSP